MNQKRTLILVSIAVLLSSLLILTTRMQAETLASPLLVSSAPQVVSYQGQVIVNDQPYTGPGYFKFAIVNATASTIYWTNDGTPDPATVAAINIPVSQGLFSVLLGDTTIPHMVALPASVFTTANTYLRVWFSANGTTFALLTPDRRITAVPYALQADLLDGLDSSAFANSAHTHLGQSWAGTGIGLAVSGGSTGLSGSGSVYGVYGNSSDTGGAGIYGTSSSSTGYGGYFSNTASTNNSYAVYGYTSSTAGIAGYFYSDNNSATTGAGVLGRDDSDDGFGLAGHNYYAGVGVGAWSYDGNLIEAYDGDFPGGTLRFYVTQAGNIYTDGSYNTFGVSTLDGMTHAMSTVQSTEAWLEDFGRASLTEGSAVVMISPDFIGMSDLKLEYHVFLTPMGDSQGLYVSNLTPTSFEVHEQGGGKANIEFSYRIVARPAGAARIRLPEVVIPPAVAVETERQPEGEQ